jgi:hypothetical protein
MLIATGASGWNPAQRARHHQAMCMTPVRWLGAGEWEIPAERADLLAHALRHQQAARGTSIRDEEKRHGRG